MTLVAVLVAIADAGGRFLIGPDGGLIYRGPKAAITDDLRAAIAAHRPCLIAVAEAADRARPPPTVPESVNHDDWRECEAAISAARGSTQDALWVAETTVDPARRRALIGYVRRVGG